MDERALDALQKAVTEAAKKISSPLSILALLALADEFYTKEERGQLVAKYQELRAADHAAYAALDAAQKALTESTPVQVEGYDARVKLYGAEAAAEQVAGVTQAREGRRETLASINSFEKEHGLIVGLIDFRDKFPGDV